MPADDPHPLDAMTAAPHHHDVLLENDQVRVLDTRLGPGERTPVHTHRWPAVLYILGWSDFIRYDPDGNVLVDSRTCPCSPRWARRCGRRRSFRITSTTSASTRCMSSPSS
jgi:hypothetical protein